MSSPNDDTIASNAGSAYIFKHASDDSFSQLAKLQADNAGNDDKFGSSVAIDGNYIVVSAPYEDVTLYGDITENNAGSTYIFKRSSDDRFPQLAKLQAEDAAVDDHFGRSIAIDGDYIIVSATGEDTIATNAGSAYIFKHSSDDSFSQLAKLQADDAEENDFFGHSVAIDGDYIVLSSPYKNNLGRYNTGSVYIFLNDYE